jgi:very-short-patch-repair endonuclease
MAGRWPRQRVESMLETALASRQISIDDVLRRHMQLHRRGRKGVRVVDALLDARLDGQHRSANRLERAIRAVIVAGGFGEPERQYKVVVPGGSNRYIDLAFPHERVGIEVDGYRWHAARTPWAADQARNNELVALGWRILRTTDEMLLDPAAFLGQLRSLLVLAA